MEIIVVHDGEQIVKCDIWKIVMQIIMNKPFPINPAKVKIFVNNVEVPMPPEIQEMETLDELS